MILSITPPPPLQEVEVDVYLASPTLPVDVKRLVGVCTHFLGKTTAQPVKKRVHSGKQGMGNLPIKDHR